MKLRSSLGPHRPEEDNRSGEQTSGSPALAVAAKIFGVDCLGHHSVMSTGNPCRVFDEPEWPCLSKNSSPNRDADGSRGRAWESLDVPGRLSFMSATYEGARKEPGALHV